MGLSVRSCGNRNTWDATVRVTGGEPQLLWGIGEAEAASDDRVGVDRVVVQRAGRTVGYGQLLVFPEDKHTVVEARALHVKRPGELCDVLEALQRHVREHHGGAVLRVSPDTAVSPELVRELEAAGYSRRDKIRRGQAGPRQLSVRLGETQGELSRRLSEETLERCRTGLRVGGITVRRVSATTEGLVHMGLRTTRIAALLDAVGENSVFLVATEHLEDGQDAALGYLWFVHTGEAAMLYRHGFTERARQLGVDDALLLTGLVQLQERRVHKVAVGNPDDDELLPVLRELADDPRQVLGTWEFPLLGAYQLAGRAARTRRKLFGGRRQGAEPDGVPVLAEQPARQDRLTAPSAPRESAETVDADPDLVRRAPMPGPEQTRPPDRSRSALPAVGRQAPENPPEGPAPGEPTGSGGDHEPVAPGGTDDRRRPGADRLRRLARRAVAEGGAAIRDAARW